VAEGVPYAACHRRSIADGPVLVDGPHFRFDRITGAPDAATLAAYPGALLALPLAGEITAKDGSARAGAGECLVADGLGSLDFSAAQVTLLTRPA
jgi:mannose-6-phosphate isomerase